MSRIKLDPIDLRILATLQREGRITKLALAERAGLSPTPCWERLKRLERAGIISGYHARVELRRLAPAATVIAEITLHRHRQADFAAFEARVRDTPEIVECWAVGGGLDYILRIVTPDIDAYQRLIDRMLEAELGIDRYFTYIVTKPVKNSPELPLSQLVEAALARAAS
jgi:Lrp/AsnC family transcriptional regulator of ectoine degradation